MGTLEKILEEIDAHSIEFEMFGVSDDYISVGWVKEIIRKHMNDGWIPVEKRLPEDGGLIEEAECPEFNVTIEGAEKATTLNYSPADGTWFDDLGNVYSVIAWKPLPELYRPEESRE